jgi:hypothetical protein
MSKEDNKFPVLGKTGNCKFVKWDKLNEKQAQTNHSQSLARLAERGGLAWEEIYCNYYSLRWGQSAIDPKLWKAMVDDVNN